MVTQTAVFSALPSGMTLTAKLFTISDPDTVAYTSDSVVNRTNANDEYVFTFGEVPAISGNYTIKVFSGAVIHGTGKRTFTGTDGETATVTPEVAVLNAAYDAAKTAASQSSVDNLTSLLEWLGIVQSSPVGNTGNDTTHIHLTGLTYANDGINDLQITILEDATGLKYSRWITDWVLSTELATIDLLPFVPGTSDTYWISAIRRNVDATKIGNSKTAADNISAASEAMIRFTVSGSPTPTTTSIPTSACDIPGVDVNQFKGMIMKFDRNTITPALRGQTTDITDSTASATPTFTVVALTIAPVGGDTGIIL